MESKNEEDNDPHPKLLQDQVSSVFTDPQQLVCTRKGKELCNGDWYLANNQLLGYYLAGCKFISESFYKYLKVASSRLNRGNAILH